MSNVSRLQVTYTFPKVDIDFDKDIEKFFSELGFVCIDRKYHFIAYKRELFFEKHGEEVDESPRSEKAELKT